MCVGERKNEEKTEKKSKTHTHTRIFFPESRGASVAKKDERSRRRGPLFFLFSLALSGHRRALRTATFWKDLSYGSISSTQFPVRKGTFTHVCVHDGVRTLLKDRGRLVQKEREREIAAVPKPINPRGPEIRSEITFAVVTRWFVSKRKRETERERESERKKQINPENPKKCTKKRVNEKKQISE